MSFLHPEVVSGWRTSNIITTTTLLTLLMAAGCAGTQWGKRIAYSPASFVEAMQAQAPEMLAEDLVIPFAVTPEMVVRAKLLLERMPLLHTDIDRANRLMDALTDEDEFGLVYDSVATSPPAITVERGYGNCLALTSIFIGLAREVGLVAYYVDASNRINDLRREEEIIVDSGHIAGVVLTEKGYTFVDYDGHAQDYRTFEIIDDITALAHYYNNLGFELIFNAERAGEPVPREEALRNFELAITVRPDFTRAHNNLGVAHTQLGDPDSAAAAYRTAIEMDPKTDAAYHNLANLQMRAGDLSGALALYTQALEVRRDNPYLHYHRGLVQYRLGDLGAAEESFKRAVRLQRDYIEAHNLLAQVYYQQGRIEEAEEVKATVQLILAGKR